MTCKECGLYVHSAPPCIPGSGNKRADIMIVNSNAKDIDENNHEATMDKALRSHLMDVGIDPEKVYYTNLIKCRTPYGTKLKISEIKKCKLHLDKEINEVKPRFILLLGAQALKAFSNDSITGTNGIAKEGPNFKYMASYAPGIIYRDVGKTPYVIQAFNNFADMVNGSTRELPELNLKIISNLKQLNSAFRYLKLKGYKKLTYDIETTGLNRFKDYVNLLGFGNDRVQYIIPLNVKYSPLRNKRIAQKKLVRLWVEKFEELTHERIAQNGKFDDLFLGYHFGVKPIITFDTMLASHALDENTPNGLKENAVKLCNAIDWDIDKNLKKGNIKTKKDYDNYLTYLGYDIYYTFKLYGVLKKQLRKDPPIEKIFNHIYMPASRVYEESEEHGVPIRREKFTEAEAHIHLKLKAVRKKLKRYKKIINWSSTQQVGKLLFEELKLPVMEETDTGNPSTAESALMRLRDLHPIAQLILDYRGIKIQLTHFIEGWIDRMFDGKIYPKFKLNGTVTGRTSCTDPNLQQVPRDKAIRTLIGNVRPGWKFVEADYSQAELRIATMMSGEREMRRIYVEGGDIHDATYNIVSGEDINDEKDPAVKKEKRKKAKAVNFGFLYGMGWKKFKDYARDTYGIKLTEAEAKQYRARFFDTYGDLADWHIRQRRIVKAQGQVRSLIGRLRRLPDINSSDQGKRAEAERQSINSPVQGFGSDLTLLGLIESMGYAKYYHKKLKLNRDKCVSIGTVHDAVLWLVQEDYLSEFVPKVKAIMENPKALVEVFNFKTDIPIVVDIEIGDAWGDTIGWEDYFKQAGIKPIDLGKY